MGIRTDAVQESAGGWPRLDWELLHTFETVARAGSLTKAARVLAMSQSTVSRQLARLEALAGSPLLLREIPLRLTERGAALLAAMEPMIEGALAAGVALEHEPELRGEVAISTTGELLRWHLVQRLPALYRAHPRLRLRFRVENRISSLAAGEADIALRMVRPDRGELVARRMATITYGYFVAKKLRLVEDLPWLGLSGSLAEVPEQRFMEAVFGARPPRLLVEDVESLGLAVEAGLGVAILPRGSEKRLRGLREIDPAAIGVRTERALPSRDVWVVVHKTRQRIPRVRAVLDWLEQT